MQLQHRILLSGILAAASWLGLHAVFHNRTLATHNQNSVTPPPSPQIVGFSLMLRLQREGAPILDARRSGRPIPGAVPFDTQKDTLPSGPGPVVILAEANRFSSIVHRFESSKNLYLVMASRLETHDQPGIPQLTPQQVRKRRDVAILDVSEPDEFAHAHIAGSRQINFVQIANGERSFLPPRSRPIVLTCPIGHRSQVAAQFLKREGYKAYNLRGGIIGWESAGLPLVRNQKTLTPKTS